MIKKMFALLLCAVLLCSCSISDVTDESSSMWESSDTTDDNNTSSQEEISSEASEISSTADVSDISDDVVSEAESEASTADESDVISDESSSVIEDSRPEDEVSSEPQGGPVKVAYIPIDNRPVNFQRVQWLAESVGLQLCMPDEQLFRSVLDNMQPNDSGLTYGDRQALLEWLKEQEDECDYFIISLDQILSGGLVASRWFSNTDLSFEYEVIDYISQLSEKHHVILFDTVMRLASTVNYQGYSLDDYSALREYGIKERALLEGNKLNVENIIKGYEYAPNGSKLRASVSDEKMKQYLGARARKLRLCDYILRNLADSIDYCYVGVDDSYPGNTIQTNEIAYINTILPKDRSIVYAGTDEFGMMCIARVCFDLYGSAKVNIKFYGGGEDLPGDNYDYESLIDNTYKKLVSMGCTVCNDSDALQVLIATDAYHSGSSQQAVANDIISAARYNIQHGIPTVVIDPSANNKLRYGLVDSGIPLTMLLGYSNWNTSGNSLGLALSMGVSRFLYLKNDDATEESHVSFVKSMTFAYLKDISYKAAGIAMGNLADNSPYSYSSILKKINASEIITDLSTYKTASHGNVRVSNFRYPWNRTFEMVFDIDVS